MSQQPLTWQTHDRVKVIKTGEVGTVAYRQSGSKMFYMDTIDGSNSAAVFVFMQDTGEFRTYALSALVNVTD